MAKISRISTILLAGCACAALSACGADSVASPGEGTIVIPAPTPTPTPPATPTPTPAATPAAACPSGPFTDRGVIANMRNCEISGTITANLALAKQSGLIYSLSGRVNIGTDAGAATTTFGPTLTIDPGVVIFASSGLDYMVVNRGARINAVGTATQPIIFTSRQNVLGTATDASSGQWGGLVLLGRAPVSDCNASGNPDTDGGTANCERILEGTTDVRFGGAQPAESSGTLRYMQIRYSGFELAPGNELQGLTLGGVGSGTDISFVQVHNSSDDGIEVFGGRSNMKRLVLTGAEDDSLDTDVGYKGFIQYLIAVQRSVGDRLLEIDSTGNVDRLPRQNVRLANFTLVGNNGTRGVTLHGGADYSFINGTIRGATNCIDIDNAQTVATTGTDEAGPPVFRSVYLTCTNPFEDDSDVTAAAIGALFATGTNNNTAAGTSTLAGVFTNGANETAVTPFDAKTINAYFDTTTYIGAVKDANDTWYRGWTCDSGYVSFGSNSSCTALPAA